MPHSGARLVPWGWARGFSAVPVRGLVGRVDCLSYCGTKSWLIGNTDTGMNAQPIPLELTD